VQVRKTPTGFAASVGKETFDVTLTVSIPDGTIRMATLDNPVTRITRQCSDIALSQCDEPRANPIVRHVEMTLLRER
jgi:hypothetical protein